MRAVAQRVSRAVVRVGDEVVGEMGRGCASFIAWQVASTRRYLLTVEARQAQAILEPDAAPLAVGEPSERSFAVEVQRVLDRAIANLVEDVRGRLEAELDQAGR